MTIEQLKELSIEALKAMAYDTLARLENEQNNMKVLNQLIAEKSQTKVDPKAE